MNCQLSGASRLFRSCSHTSIHSLTVPRPGIRRLRHWPHRALNSICAEVQLDGVYIIRTRLEAAQSRWTRLRRRTRVWRRWSGRSGR